MTLHFVRRLTSLRKRGRVDQAVREFAPRARERDVRLILRSGFEVLRENLMVELAGRQHSRQHRHPCGAQHAVDFHVGHLRR
jgi:hypothetical protein